MLVSGLGGEGGVGKNVLERREPARQGVQPYQGGGVGRDRSGPRTRVQPSLGITVYGYHHHHDYHYGSNERYEVVLVIPQRRQ